MATTPEHTATTEAAGEHGGGGLPQFEFQYWGGQIVWLLLIFGVLYVLLARVFTPRIRRVIDERAASIAGAVASARSVQAQADAEAKAAEQGLADARAAAQRTAADAKTKAQAEAAERRAAEDAELDRKTGEAEARIRETRQAAMASVGAVAADAVQSIVEKLTGKAASAEDASAAVSRLSGVEGNA